MNDRQAPARRDMNFLLQRVDQAKDKLAQFLPAGVDVDHFIALARRQIAEQPRLAECDATSVIRELSKAASSGLQLDGQFSSLIIRNSRNGRPTATWDPTYRGMISLAMSSGFVSDVQAYAVTEHDEFEIELGTEPKVRHIPALLQGGKLVAAYAWARLTNGSMVLEVVGRQDLDKIKRASPAGEKGPWGHWEAQMARKSAVRRLLKRLPAAPIQSLLANSGQPRAGAPTPAVQAAAQAITQPIGPSSAGTMPEDENTLECRALEQLGDANTVGELAAAYAQISVEYHRAGINPTQAVERRYRDLRDEMEPDEGGSQEHDEWLEDYSSE